MLIMSLRTLKDLTYETKHNAIVFIDDMSGESKKAVEHAEQLRRRGKIDNVTSIIVGSDLCSKGDIFDLVVARGGKTGWVNVDLPQVFINGQYIGTWEEFKKFEG
jgi:hypothetical protein